MGRKPVGKKTMTAAERQRRRRQKLRDAKTNSVTDNLSRNGQRSKGELQEILQKKIDRLEKENKLLREEAKGWKGLHDDQVKQAEQLREQLSRLGTDVSDHKRFKAEKQQFEFEKRCFEMDRLLKPSVVTTWYRELAKKYHPDRTLDDGTAMKAINAARDLLRELLLSQGG